MKRIALMPAYEPDMKMIYTLIELQKAGFEIIVVNDGSEGRYDDLFRWAEDYASVIRQPENMGKGKAIKTGLSYIRDHYTESYTVVTVDSDGQHKAEDAVWCCLCAEDNPASLILGSRQAETETVKVPLRSRFGNELTRWVFRLRAKVQIHDTQTGLRAFSDLLVTTLLNIPGDRYEYEMNMLLYCADEKIPMIEVPIAKIYIDENETSHFDPIKDSLRIYRCIFKVPDILKFGLSSFLGFLTDYDAYALLVTLAGTISLPTAMAVTISNIAARVLSASVNYTVNRKFVFRSSENKVGSALKYAVLACGILAGNTLLLNYMVEGLWINRYAAKLVTELTFFTASWFIQKKLIFRQKNVEKTTITTSHC